MWCSVCCIASKPYVTSGLIIFYFQRLEVIGNPCSGVSEMEWKFTRCHATDVINFKILIKANSNFIVHQVSLCGLRLPHCLDIIIIKTSMLAMAVSASVFWTTMTLLSSVLKMLSQDYCIWCTIRISMIHWTRCLAVSSLCEVSLHHQLAKRAHLRVQRSCMLSNCSVHLLHHRTYWSTCRD